MKFRFALTELMQEIKTNVLFKMFSTSVYIVGWFIAAFLLSSFQSFVLPVVYLKDLGPNIHSI